MSNLPDWLNDITLEKIVSRRFKGQDVEILKVRKETKDGNSGDHYLSEIIRFSVVARVSNREITSYFVIKDMGKGLSDFVVDVNGKQKEMSLYEEVVPVLNGFLGSSLTPEIYYTGEGCLVLEDLSAVGYSVADRLSLLDFDHCSSALRTLAKFHASTHKVWEMSPSTLDVTGEETMFNGNKDSISYYFGKINLNSAAAMLKGHSEGNRFAFLVEKLAETFWDDAHRVLETHSGLKVLNHGDFWTTNILFRYSEGEIAECKLIDFQITRFSTPAIDLHQFIALAVEPSVRDRSLPELLDIYTTTLNSILSSLGSSSRMSRTRLDEILHETRIFALLYGLTLTQIVLCDPDDPLELAGVSKAEFRQGFPLGNPYSKGYNQDSCRNHIVSLLHFYERQHYLS